MQNQNLRKNERLRVAVGRPWEPKDLDLEADKNDHASKVKRLLIVGFAVLFGAMFAAYGVYGLFYRDAEVMKQVWTVLTYGLAAVGVWAIGHSVLTIIGNGLQKSD